MANDATEVRVASDGHIWIGNVGATAPTDAIAAPGVGWDDLGYASDDGVTLTPGLDTNPINAWQSSVPVRSIVNGSSLEIGFTLLQSNQTTMQLYFNATITADVLEIPVAPVPLERALIIDWIDGAEEARLFLPRVQLADTGDAKIKRGDATMWELKFSALAPATGPLARVFGIPAAA